METKRYIIACLGGVLGGVIASIPWLVLYMFGGLIVSALAVLIAPGVNYGYRKLKGRVNRKLPIIIIGISLFILVLINLLILPIYYCVRVELAVNIKNILNFITSAVYWQSLFRELIISTVFAIVGTIKVVNDIKYEVGINY